MAVVGDDRPADGVDALPQIGPERNDERARTRDVWLASEDGPAAVADRFDARPDPNDVVEDDADLARRAGQGRPGGRRGANERRVRPPDAGQRERGQRDDVYGEGGSHPGRYSYV